MVTRARIVVAVWSPLLAVLACLPWAVGCGGQSPAQPPPGDTQPPGAPAELSAKPEVGGRVVLSWQASTDNVAVVGYRVFRDATRIATATETTYADSGLAAGSRHCYFVVAYDAAENSSPPSSEACAVLTDSSPPSAPSALTATTGPVGEIELAWTASTDDVGVVSYEIARDGARLAMATELRYSDTGILPGSHHCYTVAARDAAGNTSAASDQACADAGKDASPPSAPTGLAASAVTATEIDLSWTASTDDVGVAGYEVWRDGAKIASSASTTYADRGLEAESRHCYQVKAFDAAGNVSGPSDESCAGSGKDTTPPSVPQDLVAKAGAAGAIDLTWTASTDDRGVTGYTVFRDGATLAPSATASFGDSGLVPGSEHCYTVTAQDAAGNSSPPSRQACVAAGLDISPPATVRLTAITSATVGGIDLAWEASTDDIGVVGYRVTRDGQQIKELASSVLAYADAGLTSGSTHCYSVQAYDAAQNVSVAGNPACASARSSTPPARLTISSGRMMPWAVAAGEGGYAVAMMTFAGCGGGGGIGPCGAAVQLLDVNGVPAGPLLTLSTVGGAPWVASDGKDYLAVWSEEDSTRRIYGQRVSSAGALLGSQVTLAQTEPDFRQSDGFVLTPLAYGGGDYLLVFANAHGSDKKVHGQFISPAGALDGAPFAVSAGTGLFPVAAANGAGDFLVAWDGLTSVRSRLVSRSGPKSGEVSLASKLDCSGGVSGEGPFATTVSAAASGTSYLVAWAQPATACSSASAWRSSAAVVDAAGSLQGNPVALGGPAEDQLLPRADFDGHNFLVAWSAYLSGGSGLRMEIRGQYLTPAGSLIGSALRLTDRGKEFLPSVVFGHGKYLAVWAFMADMVNFWPGDPEGAFVTP